MLVFCLIGYGCAPLYYYLLSPMSSKNIDFDYSSIVTWSDDVSMGRVLKYVHVICLKEGRIRQGKW